MAPTTTSSRRRAAAALASALLLIGGCAGDPAASDAAGGSPDIPTPLDAAGADPGPAVEDALDPDAPGLGIDWASVPAGAAVRYDPAGAGWTATPWPSDRLRAADGSVDLSTFPNPGVDQLTAYSDYGEEVLDGWGLNSSAYFELSGALDEAALPDPATTLQDPKAVIQLVNVTPDSARYGEQMPLVFKFYSTGKDKYFRDNTLAARPVFGFPMAEGETYCALMTRGVKDAAGRYLAATPGFVSALASEPSLAPLAAWLPASKLLPEDLAAATCFTTQRATRLLRTVLDFLDDEPLPAITDLEYLGKAAVHHEFRGHYLAPNFQAGVKPYDLEGGDLQLDASGQPIVQEQESIRFLLMIPTGFDMPAAGWPVITYAHGTTGDYESCKGNSFVEGVGPPLLREGVALICIDQPLHGERAPAGGLTDTEVVLYSFNFLNPRAGRFSFQQSAIDTMSLTRMVAGGNFDIADGETSYSKGEVRFDPANIAFFGHSHGGISGALVFGVDPQVSAGVLSGAGGVLIQTILLRKDPFDLSSLFANALDIDEDDLDAFHPALSLIQTLVDATDPINYAPYWLNPAPGGVAKHVFVTEGTADAATPSVGTEAMAAAAGVPLLEPVVHESLANVLHGLGTRALPVTHNVTSSTGEPRTAGLAQWDGGDHFVALDQPSAIAMWKTFFHTIRKGLPPTIGL